MLSNISLNHKITVRYLIAVAFIALLSTSTYLSFSYLLKNNETTAAIINISGKQRMLSQRTALFTKQLVSAKSSVEIEEIKSLLAQAVDMMQTGHLALISGSTELHIPQKHSKDIHDMYFGELQMDRRVTAYIEAIQKLLSSPVNTLNTDHLDYIYIDKHFNPLLVDLNNIVTQYQKEGEESVRTIQNMELFLWLLTLLILLLEIQLIFRPMNKQVSKALEERENYEHRLEKEIKKQTKKLVEANIKLNKLSNTDPLTGLRNRRGLQSKLNKLHRLYTENNNGYSLAIIDLDFFKNLNDTYGHDCGDTVLKKIADALIYSLDEETIISRFGGEEFVLLFPNCDDFTALQILEKLKENISQMEIKCEENLINVTFSAGITSTENFSKIESTELLSLADIALYQAKGAGRNQIRTYSDVHFE